jgi:hypothetical protein
MPSVLIPVALHGGYMSKDFLSATSAPILSQIPSTWTQERPLGEAETVLRLRREALPGAGLLRSLFALPAQRPVGLSWQRSANTLQPPIITMRGTMRSGMRWRAMAGQARQPWL